MKTVLCCLADLLPYWNGFEPYNAVAVLLQVVKNPYIYIFNTVCIDHLTCYRILEKSDLIINNFQTEFGPKLVPSEQWVSSPWKQQLAMCTWEGDCSKALEINFKLNMDSSLMLNKIYAIVDWSQFYRCMANNCHLFLWMV